MEDSTKKEITHVSAQDVKGVFLEVLRNPRVETVLKVDTPLETIPYIDSMTMIKVMVELEKRFGMRFDEQNLEKVAITIDSIAEYINKRRISG